MIPLPRTLPAIAIAAMLSACRSPSPAPVVTAPSPVTKPTPAPVGKPAPPITKAEVTSVSFDVLFNLQQSGKVLLFDSRLPIIHRLGHIPGSINMPLHRCEERIKEMEPDLKSAIAQGKTIVTYCSGPDCPDSHKLAVHFSNLGYPASVFTGGWQAWSAIQ